MKTLFSNENTKMILMETFRGFIAVDVPPASKIVDFKNALATTPAKLKMVKTENIHLTLKFLGETPITQLDHLESMMKKAVSPIEPHMVSLQGTGVFPNKNYIKVIWIGIKQVEHLSRIASFLNENLTALGFKKEKRDFSAHLTIARVKSAQGKKEINSVVDRYSETIFEEFAINSIMLKKSTLTPQGPIYETLKTISL